MALRWYGKEAKARVRHAAAYRIEAAARSLRDYLRQQLSVPGPAPSAPGEYPHKQRGHLRRNVQMEMSRAELKARIGTNVLYGRFLEFGTRRMAARPWLSRGHREFLPSIKAILSRGPTV